VFTSGTTSAAVVLAAGGTWAYWGFGNAVSGGIYSEWGGIAAGGTTVAVADATRTAFRNLAWRIT
jgi:hypothetical protein